MKNSAIFALLAGASLVAAVPLEKRDLVVVTSTTEVVEYVDVTVTITVGPDGTPIADAQPKDEPAPAAAQVTDAPSAPVHEEPQQEETQNEDAYVPEAHVEEVKPVQEEPKPVQEEPKPVQEEPKPVQEEPKPEVPAPVVEEAPAPEPEPEVKPEAPVQEQTPPPPAPPVVQPAKEEAPQNDSYGPAPGAGEHAGHLTFYDTDGTGACGWQNDGWNENVVALSHLFMGELSNSNPYCGKTVTVYLNDKSVQCKVVDKCMGCDKYSIDLSRAAFYQLATEAEGRIETGMTWSIN